MSDSSKHTDLNLFQCIALELLWGFSRLMNISPRWVRFGIFQPLVTTILHLIGYRRKIIMSNLESVFPEKSKSDIRKIRNRFYSTLAEIVVDTISMAGTDRRKRGCHAVWDNGEEHLKRVAGRDWIAYGSHYGCWEYFPMWAWETPNDDFMTVYHPLRSKVFEAYYLRLRNIAPNVNCVSMANTLRYYISHRSTEHGICLGLASDQSPRLTADTEWIDFLGRKTAFVDGGERIALKFNIPAYFCHVRRIRAGEYAVRFEQIYDGVEEVEHHEITRRYARRLEQMIRECPELWMWSHNRWKHTPEKQARKFGKSTLE